jgi:N-acetylmuramoyl-L-alanine amidase
MPTIRRALAWLWPLLLVASPVAACDSAGFAIAIDPGHTRASPGATSARGVPEVQFNAQLAEVVLRELRRAGFAQSFLTVEDQAPVTLPERPARAEAQHARLFLSLHHDAVQPQYLSDWVYEGRSQRYSDRFSGYSLFVSARNADEARSLRMAQLLGAEFRRRTLVPTLHHAEPIAGENRPLLDPALGIYRFDDLVVLKRAAMPAVLIEAGLIVNRADELQLDSASFRQTLAEAITAAARQFCDEAPDAPPGSALRSKASSAARATPAAR